MMPQGSELYQEWLLDRGLGETPAVSAAGVFLHNFLLSNNTLVISEFRPDHRQTDIDLLQRLAIAIGVHVSIIAIDEDQTLPWSIVLDNQPSLQQMIDLGDRLQQSVKPFDSRICMSGCRMIYGASPEILQQDLEAKRSLWRSIQEHIRTS